MTSEAIRQGLMCAGRESKDMRVLILMYRLFQKSSSHPEVQKGTPKIFSYLSASRILTLAPRGPKSGGVGTFLRDPMGMARNLLLLALIHARSGLV
eukprot:scaffold481_cov122-Isochrysis_galbana.AAC.1